MTERSTVLVLQAGLRPGPWTCRSLVRAGFRVVGGHEQDGRIALRSRFCRRPQIYPAPRVDPDGFLAAVEGICKRESIDAVLPLSETALHLLVDGNPDLGRAVLVGPSLGQYRSLCDKGALHAAAAETGVDTPATVIVDETGPRGDWPPLPGIVKPLYSATPRSAGVVYRSAVIVSTEAERDRAVAEVIGQTGAALVQERIEGQQFIAHFHRGAETTQAAAFSVSRSYPPGRGMSAVSRLTPMPPRLGESLDALLQAVDYRGPGGMQAILRDGTFFIHDVNLRIQYGVAAPIGAGLDVPRLAVRSALGLPTEGGPAKLAAVEYVWAGGELRALVDGLRSRDAAAPPGAIASGLLRALCGGRRVVLDPVSLADPLGAATALARLVPSPIPWRARAAHRARPMV